LVLQGALVPEEERPTVVPSQVALESSSSSSKTVDLAEANGHNESNRRDDLGVVVAGVSTSMDLR
jgi:hypothetical protein